MYETICLRYRLAIDTMAPEDGGGIRVYFPTLGYAAYGRGDTFAEAIEDLKDSVGGLEDVGAELPPPSADDLIYAETRKDALCEARTNFAYAA